MGLPAPGGPGTPAVPRAWPDLPARVDRAPAGPGESGRPAPGAPTRPGGAAGYGGCPGGSLPPDGGEDVQHWNTVGTGPRTGARIRGRRVSLHVRQDDLSSPEVQALVAEHLAGMHGNSPPGHVHALAIDSLRAPGVTFWTAWDDGALCGCGALKELDARSGEIKSMRTRAAFLRRGVGQALLDRIVATARERGYARLLLETGTGPAFDPAHALYLRNGFAWCGAFGDYVATDFNVFMARGLD